MKRLVLIATVTLALAALVTGCGEDEEEFDFAGLFPTNSEVGSWVEDTSALGYFGTTNGAGVETATTKEAVSEIINGDVSVFDTHGFLAFGVEFYTDGSAKLQLRIWEMLNKSIATTLYHDLPNDDVRYDNTWTTVAFGDDGRMVDTGNSYWYNVRKGAYFIDLMDLKPNDAATKTAGEAFLSEVLDEVP